MAKLSSVVRHEYTTIIKQPSFWIVMIAIPVLVGIIFALNFFAAKSSSDRIDELAKDLKNVAIVDESGLLNERVVASAGLAISPASEADALKQDVRSDKKEALVIFPKSLQKDRNYQIYLSSTDFTKMSSVSSLADNLLKTSLFLPLGSAEIVTLAQDGANSQITTYKNGTETAGFNEYVVPAIFLILFYIIFMFSIGYMLTSISEEKENRSMEMVLTYVKPRTLIVGKLLGVSLVTITQILFFIMMAVVGYLVLRQASGEISLPGGIEMDRIVFSFWPIFFGFSYLIVGFLMFAGFMIATAAIAPSSKEANSFSSFFFLAAFLPFYLIMTIITDPANPIVQTLTYLPFTSPVVTLIRNTVGNMGLMESWAALGVMIIGMILSIWIAIRAFRLGALEFGQTVKLGKIFKNHKTKSES